MKLTRRDFAAGLAVGITAPYVNVIGGARAQGATLKIGMCVPLGTYFTFENDLGIFARQLRQLGVNIPWVGSPSVVAVSSTKLAGPALYGTYGVADYAEDSSEASKVFGKAYRDAYKTAPDNQSAWPYDAVTVLAAAINKAGSTDPTKIREAILSLKNFPGAEGEYNFDQNGDGLHGYNVVRNEKGTIVYDKHIDFND